MIRLLSFSGSFSHRLRRGVVILLTLGGLSLLASACSSSPSPQAAPTTTTRPLSELKNPTVTIHGHTYPVPTGDGGKPIDNAVDSSGQIVLTDKGFLPQKEIAGLNEKLTWTNLSSHPVTISFSHMPGTQPHRLPVGGTFTYSSPTLINFEYLSSNGFHGIVSIGAFTS